MNQELETTNQENKIVAHPASGGIGVIGLEDIPVSMMGIPFIKMVQPVSQNIEQADGTDAPLGSFFLSDVQKGFDTLTVALITAKRRTQTFDNDDGPKEVDQVAMLVRNLENGQNYILSLSISNFATFGRLMSLVTSEGWTNAWDKALVLTTEKIEGKRGKYFVIKFTVGDALTQEQSEAVTADWMQLGGYFDREEEVTEDVDPNEIPL